MKKLDLQELIEIIDSDMVIAEKVNELVDWANETDHKLDKILEEDLGLPEGKFEPASTPATEPFESLELPEEKDCHCQPKDPCVFHGEPKEKSLDENSLEEYRRTHEIPTSADSSEHAKFKEIRCKKRNHSILGCTDEKSLRDAEIGDRLTDEEDDVTVIDKGEYGLTISWFGEVRYFTFKELEEENWKLKTL